MRAINFNFNTTRLIAHCLLCYSSRTIERFRILTTSGQRQYLSSDFFVLASRDGSPREIPRLENYTPARRTSDYPWPVVEELKLNDEVNVRFLRDFEMHPHPPGASCSFFSRPRYFFPFLLSSFFSSFFPFPFAVSRNFPFSLVPFSIPGVFSLNKLAALGNKTRLLFISAFFYPIGATKWVVLNCTTMQLQILWNKLLIHFD